jgi:ABC-type amino acid transport substrate-binding protein
MADAIRRLVLIAIIGAIFGTIAAGVTLTRWRELRRLDPEFVFARGELRIATDGSFPPFAIAEGNDLYGLDVEIGLALGEKLDMPVRFVNMGFDGLYDSLLADQVDVIISTLLVEFWRMNDVLYTRPYFNAGLMLVSDDEQHRFDSMEDIAGHSLAYEFGSAADAEARRWSRRIERFKAMPYELPEYALDAVRMGEADAALVDAVSARLYLRQHRDWQASSVYVTDELYVIAVHIDRPGIYHLVDRALNELLHEGVIAEIIRRWL